ncbi:MAG: hypothetical protein ACJ8E5_25600, partial [Xanthobacteraceae bacterium]
VFLGLPEVQGTNSQAWQVTGAKRFGGACESGTGAPKLIERRLLRACAARRETDDQKQCEAD